MKESGYNELSAEIRALREEPAVLKTRLEDRNTARARRRSAAGPVATTFERPPRPWMFLTAVSGYFYGAGEVMQIVDGNGRWWLQGHADQRDGGGDMYWRTRRFVVSEV